ncbi:hypothetical protein WDU94_013740 [Cyamophila willieti]
MLSFKIGVVIFCSNGDVQYWFPVTKDIKGQIEVWIKDSEMVQSDHTIDMATLYPTDPELLIGWTREGCLVSINIEANKIEILQDFGSGFTHLVLLEPEESYVVTLDKNHTLAVWDIWTGKLVSRKTMEL